MAQPLIKFFRVAKIADLQATQKVQGGLYFETETGILYVYNGTAFEAYSGLKSASFADQKLVLTPSVGAAIEIDLSGYVDNNEFNTELANYVKKEQTIAGIDLQDNITADELRDALGLTTAEENVLEGVKVNGEALTIAADKTVDILVAEGATNGTIAVNGKDIAVHGLGSAAYTESSAYDAAGAAAAAEEAANEYTDEAIGALDVTDAAVTNEYVSQVTQTDGKIKVNRAALPVVDVKYNDDSIVEDAVAKLEKVVDTTVTVNSANLITSGAVAAYVQSIGTVMEFKGVVTSLPTLPDEAYNAGDVVIYDNEEYVLGNDNAWHEIGQVKTDEAVITLGVQADDVDFAAVNQSTGAVELDFAGAKKLIADGDAASEKYTDDSIAGLDATVGSQTVADGKHVAVEVVETDGKLTSLEIVESDIASAQATETALSDLTERIETVADSIPTELGVMSVTKGTDGKFVTTTIDGTAADPTVSVAVSYTESTAEATALATDAYVQEQIAASALTWQLF